MLVADRLDRSARPAPAARHRRHLVRGAGARAAAALDAAGYATLVAPTLAYAITDYASEFAGTISIAPETATALVADVCASLIAQGLRARLPGQQPPRAGARRVAARTRARACSRRTGVAVVFADQLERRWARTLTDEFKRGACHAGSYETSLVLAARPELVRDEVRRGLMVKPIDLARAMREGKRTFGEAGAAEAYFGDPAAASVEEGNDIYARLVTMVVEEARAAWPTA